MHQMSSTKVILGMGFRRWIRGWEEGWGGGVGMTGGRGREREGREGGGKAESRDPVPNLNSTTPQINGDASPSPPEPAVPQPTARQYPPVNAAQPDTIINNNSVIIANAAGAALPHHPYSTTTTTTTTTTTSASNNTLNISSNVIQSNPAHHARLGSQGLGGQPRPVQELPPPPQELIHQDPALIEKERKNERERERERLIQRDHSLDRGDNRGSSFSKGPGWNSNSSHIGPPNPGSRGTPNQRSSNLQPYPTPQYPQQHSSQPKGPPPPHSNPHMFSSPLLPPPPPLTSSTPLSGGPNPATQPPPHYPEQPSTHYPPESAPQPQPAAPPAQPPPTPTPQQQQQQQQHQQELLRQELNNRFLASHNPSMSVGPPPYLRQETHMHQHMHQHQHTHQHSFLPPSAAAAPPSLVSSPAAPHVVRDAERLRQQAIRVRINFQVKRSFSFSINLALQSVSLCFMLLF
ncbi:uncharacterized protein LOC129253615 [Lytechinus pictus]|uniref:uncharacterized protein LOC129253615 n=1 Tax=Lytechinus pictus TaxID=7653 RepID=UPI0030BA00CF